MHNSIRHFAIASFGLVFLGPAVRVAHAQTSTVVRLRVTDSTRAPVAGAEVSLVRGLADAITRGTTDADGRLALTVRQSEDDDYEVVVRKMGYLRGDRFFPGSGRDTVALQVVLARVLHGLETVTITEEADLRRRAYFIDADAIASSAHPLFNALDVINKLRPDMVWGLAGRQQTVASSVTSSGRRTARTSRFGEPPAASDVWVNGQRIVYVPRDEMTFARRNSGVTKDLPLQVQYILSEIRPEHIAEMRYADPADMTVGKTHSNNALFIVLKPGVGYAPGNGSFVIDDPSNLGGRP